MHAADCFASPDSADRHLELPNGMLENRSLPGALFSLPQVDLHRPHKSQPEIPPIFPPSVRRLFTAVVFDPVLDQVLEQVLDLVLDQVLDQVL